MYELFLRGIIMSTEFEQKLKIATSGLTGLRKYDVPYLKEQMQEFAADIALVSRLAVILAAINVLPAGEAVA